MKTSVNVENSSSIKSYEYDDDTMVLTIIFNAGSKYNYYSVDPSVMADFNSAESKGKFFASNIKDKFHAEKVEENTYKGGRANLPKPWKFPKAEDFVKGDFSEPTHRPSPNKAKNRGVPADHGSDVAAAWPFPTGKKP